MRNLVNICRLVAVAAMLAAAWEIVDGVETTATFKNIFCGMAILAVLQVHSMIRRLLWISFEREKEIRRLNDLLDAAYQRHGHLYDEHDERHGNRK